MPKYVLKKAWNNLAVGALHDIADEASAQPLLDAGFVEKATEAQVLAGDGADMVVKALIPAVTKSVLEGLEPRLASLGSIQGGPGKLGISIVESHADKTKSFGDFLCCVLNNDVERVTKAYATTKAPLAEGNGTGGGFLVPPEYMATLLRLASEKSIVRSRAFVIPMGSRTIQIPALAQGGPGVAGQFQSLGGMYASWTEEATPRTETEPKFRQIELIAHELAGYSVASNTLMQDSAIALDALLTGMFANCIALHEDYAFLQGDGVGKPTGILNSDATITGGPNAGARTTASSFKLADAAWMWSKLLPSSQESAVWIMNQSVIPQLIQLQDTAGNVIFLPNFYAPPGGQGGVQASLVPMLFGRPILFTEKVPPLGTPGDVMLADFSYYLLGDRQSIQIAASEHANFLKNQMTWRFVHRVDGQSWLDGPYNYQDGVSQVSPFVVLN